MITSLKGNPIVFKVVYAHEGKLLSAFIGRTLHSWHLPELKKNPTASQKCIVAMLRSLVKEYKVGKWVKAKRKGTLPLFVFTDIVNAKIFMNGYTSDVNMQIWEAEARDVNRCHRVIPNPATLASMNYAEIANAINNPLEERTSTAPCGTHTARTVKLLKRVDI